MQIFLVKFVFFVPKEPAIQLLCLWADSEKKKIVKICSPFDVSIAFNVS